MKLIPIIMALLFFNSFKSPSQEIPQSIYECKVKGLDGQMIDFSTFKGRKILIVNTASECAFTQQYEELQKLYETYYDRLVVVGFPANNFMRQEPGTNKEIADFCQKNYGVSFPMAEKISVKGKDMAIVYQWLTNKNYNNYKNSSVKWNFQKYLIDENGNLIAIFPPATKPLSDEIISQIR